MISTVTVGLAVAALTKSVSGHASIWHPSMWGFNVTAQTFSYDNRPVVPLQSMPFSQWWFHNHLAYPPNADDFMEFPAGGTATMQISCDKGYTDYYASSPGGDNRDLTSDLACPGQPTTAIHANNLQDVAGCAIGIAYKSDVNDVQPEDFALFTANYTCPWYLNTEFQIPADMPACPEGGCICGWFWIHNPDSGSEQMYMNGFQCKITGQTGNTPIGTPGLARRCGADPANGRPDATPSNCTVGPVQPFYWDQQDNNNMFEGTYSPPLYNALYGLTNGAQPNLYQEPTIGGSSAPSAPASTPSSASVSTPAPASSLASASPLVSTSSLIPASSLAPSSSPAPAPPAQSPSSSSVPASLPLSVPTLPAQSSSPSPQPSPSPTSDSEPVPVPSSSSPQPDPTPVPVTSSSTYAPAVTVAVSASVSVSDPVSTSPALCKRREPGEKKKRKTKKTKKSPSSPVERHVKKRLARESH